MATLTETLSNGLKSLFSGLGAKTTNTTNGGVPLLNTSTGEPNGMMAMSNLASVLGGANMMARVFNGRVAETKSGNLNNLTTGIIYCANPSNLDSSPSVFTDGPAAFFYLGLNSATRGVQIGFNCSNIGGVIKIAMRGQLATGWTEWKSVTLT